MIMIQEIVYTWCIILLINSFSKTFPPTFIRLIDPNFVGSVVSSLPGFVIDITCTLLPSVREASLS